MEDVGEISEELMRTKRAYELRTDLLIDGNERPKKEDLTVLRRYVDIMIKYKRVFETAPKSEQPFQDSEEIREGLAHRIIYDHINDQLPDLLLALKIMESSLQ